MAQTIKLKRSSTASAEPTTSQLALGEVAINTYDGKMFIKKNDGSDSIVEIGTSSSESAVTTTTTTATANQTTVTGLTYTVGLLNVYLNGVKLVVGTDVTATSGSTIVLTTGAAVNDIIQTVAFNAAEAFTPASPTFTGTLTAPTINASTALQIGGVAVTSTAAELNYVDGVTSNVQTQLNTKAPTASPTFVTPALGTPASGVATNLTGTAANLTAGNVTTNANLTGHVTSTGNAAVLGSFTSAQLSTALSDETGSGAAVFATSPTLVTPALGTPASGVLTNATGLPNSSVIGLGTAALVATGTSSGNVPLVGTKSSTTTLAGLVERSTSAENVTGTDDTVYPTVAGTKEMIDTHGGSETTLTKTFTAGETSTMTLGSAVTAPVIGVTKEVAQTAVTNNDWDAAAGSYTLEDTATATTLTPSATGNGTFTLGAGSFTSADVGKTITGNGGVSILTTTGGAYITSTAFTDTSEIASGDWSMYAVVYDAAADVLETSNVVAGAPFDVSASVYLQSFSIASQETDPNGIAFNTDGTKMFIIGYNGDDVNEYALSTGFDISTASFTDAFSISAQDSIPTGLAFNTDGTKMFMVGRATDAVYEYALSTGFDVSTASYTDSFSVAGQDTGPVGIAFNTDGTKMFMVGYANDSVYEYTQSTGFDVSTSTYVDAFSIAAQDPTPTGLAFSTDGTKMFVSGNTGDDINEYALGTGFDVSTSTFVDSFSVASQDSAPQDIAFNADGTKMYVLGDTNNTVYQYALSSTTITTGYQPCISSNIDSTYWTDINSLTATNAVGDGNVFYAVSNDGKTTWSVLDNTSGVRPIARVSVGTWQYNSNTTYGSTTWTSATVNTEIQALRDSMGIASNQMNSTTLNAITDANQISLGTDLDFAVIMYYNTGATVPTYSGTAMNYDAAVLNQGAILGTDYNFDAPAGNKVRITAVGAGNYKIRAV